jgi:hypothetical protein
MIESVLEPQAPSPSMPTPQQTWTNPAPVLAALALFTALLPLANLPASAQMSPVCQRNGKRDYCALTPVPAASNARQVVDVIMFADDRVYRVERDLQSCRRISETVETCNARITSPPGRTQSLPAMYRATYFEGGVKHEYISRGLRLTYHVAD